MRSRRVGNVPWRAHYGGWDIHSRWQTRLCWSSHVRNKQEQLSQPQRLASDYERGRIQYITERTHCDSLTGRSGYAASRVNTTRRFYTETLSGKQFDEPPLNSVEDSDQNKFDPYIKILATLSSPVERSVARKVLLFLTLSEGVIHNTALAEAVAFSLKLRNSDVLIELSKLEGLIKVDTHGYLSLAHESLKAFLLWKCSLSTDPEISYFAIHQECGHAQIARVLLDYLSSDELERTGPCNLPSEWKQRRLDYPLLEHAANSWFVHCRKARYLTSYLVKPASKFWRTSINSSYGAWMQAYKWTWTRKYLNDFTHEESWSWTMWRYLEQDTSPLRQLASWGLTDFVKAALKHSEHAAEIDGALLCAIENGHLATVAMLLDHNANPYAVTADAQSTLHLACVSGEDGILELLLNRMDSLVYIAESNINTINARGETPLHIASRQGDIIVVEILLARGAEVEVYAELGCSALYYAAEHGHPYIVRLLLEAGANPNGLRYLRSPLHGACYQEDKSWNDERRKRAFQVVEELLKAGADPAIKDADNVTPLGIAAWKDHAELVELLVKHSSIEDINAETNWAPFHIPSTALRIALGSGASLRTVGALMEASYPDGPLTANNIPIYTALEGSSVEVLKYLVEVYPDAKARCLEEKSLFQSDPYEWDAPKAEILEYLWTFEAQRKFVLEDMRPSSGSALYTAATGGLLAKIIEHAKNNPEFNDNLDWNYLWSEVIEVKYSSMETDFKSWSTDMNQFLEHRPEFNTKKHLRDALFANMYYSRRKWFDGQLEKNNWEDDASRIAEFTLEKLEKLVSLRELEKETNENGETLLHLAFSQAYHKIAERLIKLHKANINAQNDDGCTPLMDCFLDDNAPGALKLGIVELLLKSGPDLSIQDKEGKTTLSHAVSGCWSDTGQEAEAIELLLKYGAGSTIEIADNRGYRPIDIAVEENKYGAMKILEDAGSEFRLEDTEGERLLPEVRTCSETGGWYPVIDRIIQESERRGENWWSDKIFNMFNGHADLPYLRMLILRNQSNLENQIYPKSEPELPVEPLQHILTKGCQYYPAKTHVILTSCTPEQREQLVTAKSEDEKKQTALHSFTKTFNVANVRWLIEAGADVTAVDSKGRTPLFFADRRGSYRTNIEGCGAESATAGYYLLKGGADADFRSPITGQTAYQKMMDMPRFSVEKAITQILKDHGADMSPRIDP